MAQEQHILQRCLNKERKAEFELYELYKNTMFGICRRYVADRDQALEIFQEGFIRVFESLHTFQGKSSLKTWMSRIFIYTALHHLRKQKRYSMQVRLDVVYNQLPQDDEQDEDEPLLPEDPEVVLAYMNQMPDNYRIVLNMFAIDGMSHAQIAEVLEISESHSRVILTRARKMLVSLINKKNNELRMAKHR